MPEIPTSMYFGHSITACFPNSLNVGHCLKSILKVRFLDIFVSEILKNQNRTQSLNFRQSLDLLTT